MDANIPGTILWVAPFYNRTGFGVGARACVIGLHRAGANIKIISVDDVQPGIDDCDLALIKSLEETPLVPPITAILSHVPQQSWADWALPEPSIKIIQTTFDGNCPPAPWLEVCNRLDQVWLNTQFDKQNWVKHGLNPALARTIAMPHPWLDESVPPILALELPLIRRPFRFLNISIFLPRRRWDALIEAYLTEFSHGEPVELYLKVSYPAWHPQPGKPKQDLYTLIDTLRSKTGSNAPIIIDEELGTRLDIMRLIDSCDTYVSSDVMATAPIGEATIRHKLVITTNNFRTPEEHFPSEAMLIVSDDSTEMIELTPEQLAYLPHHKGVFWPKLSIDPLRQAMRQAFDMPADERAKMGQAAFNYARPLVNFVPEAVEYIREAWEAKVKQNPRWSLQFPALNQWLLAGQTAKSKLSSEIAPTTPTDTPVPLRSDFGVSGGFSSRPASGRLPQPLYLNLGCGKDLRFGFVNIDLFNDDPGVVSMDIRRLDLPDACADGVLASDVLERFSHRETDTVLAEWARVLKPGGELIIRCPSLYLQAKAYLSGKWNADIASYMIFGGQTNPGDYHCIGFDEASIRRHLATAGLIVTSFEEVDTPQDRGLINLNMTVYSRKPAQPAFNQQLGIVWEGSQFVTHSLALINREVCIRLAQTPGVELSIIPYEPHQFGPDADPRFEYIAERLNYPLFAPADIHVRHQWPPDFNPPPQGHWVMIQPWEFGSLPKAWIETMSRLVDEVWAYTEYVRSCYISSGFPADRVFVVSPGVDIAKFNPQTPPAPLKTGKKFKFLFVGGTIYRKGIDVLLNAYARAFTAADDVCLVIKDMGGQTFYQGQTAQEMIANIRQSPDAPEIEYIDAILSDEKLAGLYTACNCLVHPYRGEGFGLPIAEAMACGVPVIVTGHGAALDFCNEQTAYLIPAKEVKLAEKQIGDKETVDYPWLGEPDQAALVELMRFVVSHPAQAHAIGQNGLAYIRNNFTWDKTTQTIQQRFKALSQKPIIRLQNNQNTLPVIILNAASVSQLPGLRQFLAQLNETMPADLVNLRVVGASAEVANWLDDPKAQDPVVEVLKSVLESGAKTVILLSTDVTLTPDTLPALLSVAESSPTIAAVGPVSNAAPAAQQVTGPEAVSADPAAWTETLYLGGFCLLLKSHAVRVVGGLNAALPLADALLDLYGRLKNAGFKRVVAQGVYVQHETLSVDEGAWYDDLAALQQQINAALAPGQAALANNDPETAVAEFARAAETHPQLAAVQVALAQTLLALGRADQAVPALTRAIDLVPQDPGLRLLLGDALAQSGQGDSAAESYRQAIALDKTQVAPLVRLAELHRSQQRYQAAAEVVKTALAQAPTDVDVLALYGRLMLDVGDIEGAELAWERLADAPPNHPGVAALLVGLVGKGSLRLGLADFLAQVESFQQAQDWAGAAALLKDALRYAQTGRWTPADAAVLWNKLGLCYFNLNHFNEAGVAFEQALGLTPDDPDVLSNAAHFYAAQEQYDAVTGYINRLMKIAPNDVNNLLLLGDVAIKLGELDTALMAFQKVQKLAPQTPGVADVLRELEIALSGEEAPAEPFDLETALAPVQTAQNSGDWPQAKTLLSEIAAHPAAANNPLVWNQLGLACYLTDDLAGAENAFTRALSLDGQNFDALSNLANLYIRREDYDSGTDYLNRALAIRPDDVNLLLTLGNVAVELGVFDTALMAFRRVQQLAPQTEGIAEVIAQLEGMQ